MIVHHDHDSLSHFWKILYPRVWRKPVKLGCYCNRTTWKWFRTGKPSKSSDLYGGLSTTSRSHSGCLGSPIIHIARREGQHVATSRLPIWGVSVGSYLYLFIICLPKICLYLANLDLFIGTTHIGRQFHTATFDYERVSSRKLIRSKLLHYLFGGNICWKWLASPHSKDCQPEHSTRTAGENAVWTPISMESWIGLRARDMKKRRNMRKATFFPHMPLEYPVISGFGLAGIDSSVAS